MLPVHIPNLWPNKIEALQNLERSFAADRPRALIQMATGSGKTLLAVTALYRLIKFAGARRVSSSITGEKQVIPKGYRWADLAKAERVSTSAPQQNLWVRSGSGRRPRL